MNTRRLVFVALFCLATAPLSGWAVQSLESGLQPLYARLAAIQAEQGALNQKLAANTTSPIIKAHAYWDYKVLQVEKQQLEQEIAQAKRTQNSSLVKFATQ